MEIYAHVKWFAACGGVRVERRESVKRLVLLDVVDLEGHERVVHVVAHEVKQSNKFHHFHCQENIFAKKSL
jgi:hypothetical protein